jgi:glycosidase
VDRKNNADGWYIPHSLHSRILDHLGYLYGSETAGSVWPRLEAMLRDFCRRNPILAVGPAEGTLTERDAILITYGDQVREPGSPPLQTLHQVLAETLICPISGVHILPFFPYSSDDGFSVIDHTQVNPALGTWTDVERLGQDFDLMFDAVVNHVSQKSVWFQRFLAGDPEFADWFIVLEPGTPVDWMSQVVRPRALPLLRPVQTATGPKLVWTTFSEDQIDLNYAHPPVLLKALDILLTYVERGARIIRLDAIAYLWKKIGTSCIHLEETHRVVKLMRCVLDVAAPATILITETNVPHEENISYFGSPLPDSRRTDEAQMVYQFPLAPLVMHSLLAGDATVLSRWAAGLETPGAGATFFNFTASHDGIGLMPARGLLSPAEIQALVDTTLARGGYVSYKTNADGSRSAYELNISYFDALSDPSDGEPVETRVARFAVGQAIMLSLAGVPGIYVHSLLGSRGWPQGVAQTGHNRTINRQKLDRATLEQEIADPSSLRHQVLDTYRRLLRARTGHVAFHPQGSQEVLFLDKSIFALLRSSTDGRSRLACLHNVSDREQSVSLREAGLSPRSPTWRDVISGQQVPPDTSVLALPPYAVRWLQL